MDFNIKNVFLSLVFKTYPYGYEEEVLKHIPFNLKKDKVGNYYYIIGDNPTTMFTSHLDTFGFKQKYVNLEFYENNGDLFVKTDGESILGADDKAGVTVLLYMMYNNVPGLYYFFIGEEKGRIGSNSLNKIFNKVDYLKNIKRCISFDRRGTNSIIIKQLGEQCCSLEFSNSLKEEYNKSGLKLSLDPTGIYTDSASFMYNIPECTNISVGYYNEHTNNEIQNISYLIKLCKASININWDNLPIKRKI